MKKSIGITARVVRNEYGSNCDSLEQSYIKYFDSFGISSIIIPNSESQLDNLLDKLEISGVVLSGGGDISSFYQDRLKSYRNDDLQFSRDEVEDKFLHWAIARNVPVLGICRGMQFLNVFFGGKLTIDLKNSLGENHAGVEHMVNIVDNKYCPLQTIKVNSFHNHGVSINDLADELKAFAVTQDGLIVEGIYHPHLMIAAVQWHPERKDFSDISNMIVRQLFNL